MLLPIHQRRLYAFLADIGNGQSYQAKQQLCSTIVKPQ